MKRKDDILAIIFVTMLAVIIWILSATRTETKRIVSATLHFKAPEGSSSTITPELKPVTLTFKGPRGSLDTVEALCTKAISVPIASDDGDITLNVASIVNALDSFHSTGAKVIVAEPNSLTLNVQTLVTVEASVQYSLPSIQVSSDVTIDPSTVSLQIPKSVRKELPEAISVTAVVSERVLAQLKPGIMHTKLAAVQLPESLDGIGVLVEPDRVLLSFTIQSKIDKTTLSQVRVLVAAPAEDYGEYSVSLPVKIIPNVSVEADKELITLINSGKVPVFAIVRLKSSDMEQGITSKLVATFLAILEDGTAQQIGATLEDQSLLDIALEIVPVAKPTQ